MAPTENGPRPNPRVLNYGPGPPEDGKERGGKTAELSVRRFWVKMGKQRNNGHEKTVVARACTAGEAMVAANEAYAPLRSYAAGPADPLEMPPAPPATAPPESLDRRHDVCPKCGGRRWELLVVPDRFFCDECQVATEGPNIEPPSDPEPEQIDLFGATPLDKAQPLK